MSTHVFFSSRFHSIHVYNGDVKSTAIPLFIQQFAYANTKESFFVSGTTGDWRGFS